MLEGRCFCISCLILSIPSIVRRGVTVVVAVVDEVKVGDEVAESRFLDRMAAIL